MYFIDIMKDSIYQKISLLSSSKFVINQQISEFTSLLLIRIKQFQSDVALLIKITLISNQMIKTSSLPFIRKTSKIFARQNAPSQTHVFRLGKYQINRNQLLGRGFCSQVYRAVDTQTDQQCAIKIINSEKVQGITQKRLLMNEMKHLKELKNSKHVVQLLEIIQTGKEIAIITELCRQSLLNKLRANDSSRKISLELETAVKLLKGIVLGYHQMCKCRILHRDIKPANILITADGEAKLADLGFSIKVSQVGKDRYINVGSPLYMAPEVLKGNNYSSKADMWAIGLVFLQMLIGDLPWANQKAEDLRNKLTSLNFKQITGNLKITSKLEQILVGLLQIDAKKRLGIDQVLKCLFEKEQEYMTKQNNLFKSNQDFIEVLPTSGSENTEQRVNRSKSKSSRRPIVTSNHFRFSKNRQTSKDKFRINSQPKSTSRLGFNLNSRHQNAINLKLKMNDFQQHEFIIKQQMSQLHFCRFVFKVINLLAKGKDNIHHTYYELNSSIIVQLAQLSLFTLNQIRAKIEGESMSKDRTNILQLVQKYYKNYSQYYTALFDIEPISRNIDKNYLIGQISNIINNGKQHLLLIEEEGEKLYIQNIQDEQICSFVQTMDALLTLGHMIKLLMKGCEIFAKLSNIQKILRSNQYQQGLTILQLIRVSQKINK